ERLSFTAFVFVLELNLAVIAAAGALSSSFTIIIVDIRGVEQELTAWIEQGFAMFKKLFDAIECLCKADTIHEEQQGVELFSLVVKYIFVEYFLNTPQTHDFTGLIGQLQRSNVHALFLQV